jgi:hypothetical protein
MVRGGETGMAEAWTWDVFVSYAHQDAGWVRGWLLPELEAKRLRVCADFRDFEAGKPSLVNMERAVAQSRRTLIVLTPEWVNSQWTEFESLLVQTEDPAGRQARMIPLRLKACTPPKRIAMLTYLDMSDAAQQEAQLGRLVAQIKGMRARRTRPSVTIVGEGTPGGSQKAAGGPEVGVNVEALRAMLYDLGPQGLVAMFQQEMPELKRLAPLGGELVPMVNGIVDYFQARGYERLLTALREFDPELYRRYEGRLLGRE